MSGNNLDQQSANAGKATADGIGGVFKEVKGLGDEARGSFNQFADALGDKIAGRSEPSNTRDADTIAQGRAEREQGRAQWSQAGAESGREQGTHASVAAPGTAATGATTGAAGTGAGAGATRPAY